MGLKGVEDYKSRQMFKAKSTADLGAYTPERASVSRASPRYSMGVRSGLGSADPKLAIAAKGKDSPGPGAYEPSQTTTSSARASPRYTIGQPVRHIPKTAESTPGPGSYGTAASKPSMADASKAWLKCARPATAAKMGRVEHMC